MESSSRMTTEMLNGRSNDSSGIDSVLGWGEAVAKSLPWAGASPVAAERASHGLTQLTNSNTIDL